MCQSQNHFCFSRTSFTDKAFVAVLSKKEEKFLKNTEMAEINMGKQGTVRCGREET
jgi:hypothetical protein